MSNNNKLTIFRDDEENAPATRAEKFLAMLFILAVITAFVLLAFVVHDAIATTEEEKEDRIPITKYPEDFAFKNNNNDDEDSKFDIIAKVIKIVDGDTIDLLTGDRIRLAIANTPERGVTGYQAAKDFTADLCIKNKTIAHVDLDDNQKPSFGRLVGVVYCEGKNLNYELLAQGYANISKKFCKITEFDYLCNVKPFVPANVDKMKKVMEAEEKNNRTEPYQFVKCPGDENNYPQGTQCDVINKSTQKILPDDTEVNEKDENEEEDDDNDDDEDDDDDNDN